MNKASSSDGVSTGRSPGFWLLLVILVAVLAALFYRSFQPNFVLFSNDGPYGRVMSDCNKTDFKTAGAVWQDLNWLGNEGVTPTPNFNFFLLLVGREFYVRFAAPIGLLILGLSAWLFFRQLKLAPMACFLGGIAAALNSDFLSTASWGIVDQSVCIAANYLALAAIARVTAVSPRRSWVRVILAGLAVGMGVMQGWDVGALFSLFVAAYVVYQELFMNESSHDVVRNLGCGAGRVVLVAVFAALIATNTLTSLIGTQIGGVAGMAQDEATRQARWDQATTWSLPKSEVLQIFVPGVFGYRNYWHMYDDDQPKDDQYWGLIGDNGPGSGLRRLSGTGLYAGVFVVMVSLWGILQALRKSGSPFTTNQRRAVWFWTGVLVITTLLSFGRYLPFFYRLFYSLPYASTIRNPTKFMHVFSWALMIVFAYGMHGLYVAYMENPVKRAGGMFAQFKAWLATAVTFEKAWLAGSVFAIGLAVVAWVMYAGKMDELVKYLPTVDIRADEASGVAHFSMAAVGWFILFLLLTVGLLLLVFIGSFSGARAKWGGAVIAALLLADLGRADQPWITYWDTAYKYASDPIVNFLADKPYEHRVGALVWADPNDQQFSILYAIYGTAWKQALFWYHNIQCVDIVQEPRVGQDKIQFLQGLNPDPRNNPPGLLREWELTSTRYLLGESGIVPYLNQKLDLQKQRFKIAQLADGKPATFNLALKPGAPPIDPKTFDVMSRSADFITQLDPHGQMAVIEFTGALPRACLIPNWRTSTNDTETMQTLADPNFDVHQTVLVADSIAAPPPPGPNPGTGTVAITDYSTKRIVLSADVNTPSVLLMSDRYNPKWEVLVDGKPDHLLRCNFVERGVLLQPGKHEVVFRMTGDYTTFAISLGAGVFGLLLCGWLAMTKESEPTEPKDASRPATAKDARAETAPESSKKKTKKT